MLEDKHLWGLTVFPHCFFGTLYCGNFKLSECELLIKWEGKVDNERSMFDLAPGFQWALHGGLLDYVDERHITHLLRCISPYNNGLHSE
jgi:hypothetical protein